MHLKYLGIKMDLKFLKINSEILRSKNLRSEEKLIIGTVMLFSVCFAKIEWIADQLGTEPDKVRSVINRLLHKGILEGQIGELRISPRYINYL